MTETVTPAEFSPSFDAQAAQRNDLGHLIPRSTPTIPGLQYAEATPTSTAYVDLVPAPGAGQKVRLHSLCYVNPDAGAKFLQIRFGAGSAMFSIGMAGATGFVRVPIPDGGYLEGAANEPLQVALASGTGTSPKAMALYTIESA